MYRALGFQLNFSYGSGGTSVNAWLQTSLDGGTTWCDAVALGLHRLQSAGPRRKVLVLLTDGEHNVPNPRSDWTPRQAAQTPKKSIPTRQMLPLR